MMDVFHPRVMPEPNSGCWLWIGSAGKDGYGTINVGANKYWRVHRLSWHENRGEIPKGMHVLHRCDGPTCVNPDHLFLGTDADNTKDKMAKGRHLWGEDNPPAKLTETMVKQLLADPRPAKEAAPDYNISESQFSAIRRGLYWKRIPRSTLN